MPARNRTLTAPPALIASRVEFGRVLQLAAVGEWLPGAELLDFLLWPQSRTTMRRHLPAAFVPGRKPAANPLEVLFRQPTADPHGDHPQGVIRAAHVAIQGLGPAARATWRRWWDDLIELWGRTALATRSTAATAGELAVALSHVTDFLRWTGWLTSPAPARTVRTRAAEFLASMPENRHAGSGWAAWLHQRSETALVMARFCLDLVVSLAPPALKGLPALRLEQLRPVIAAGAHLDSPAPGFAWTPAKAAFFLTAFTGLSQTLALGPPSQQTRDQQIMLLADALFVVGEWQKRPALMDIWETTMQSLAHSILPCAWAADWRGEFELAVVALMHPAWLSGSRTKLIQELAALLPNCKPLVAREQITAYKAGKIASLVKQENTLANA